MKKCQNQAAQKHTEAVKPKQASSLLEPALTEQGADDWSDVKRIRMANIFARWARQLRRSVSENGSSMAVVMHDDQFSVIAPLTPELNGYAGELSAYQRRSLALKYKSWAMELYCSAEFIDRFGDDPDPNEAGFAEQLKCAAELEHQAVKLRILAGLGNIETLPAQIQASSFMN